MKKIILGLIVCQSIALAVDIEKGYMGFEFDSNITDIRSTEELEKRPLFTKYSLMKINNDYLLKTLTDDNTDRENIYKLGYTFSKINKDKGNGFNILYSFSPEFEKRIGFNLNYTDLNNNHSTGDYGQLNIFYNYKDYSNFTQIFSTIYSGYSKEKYKNSNKLDTKFIGLYTKFSNIINYYDNFFPKIYIENDIKRTEAGRGQKYK